MSSGSGKSKSGKTDGESKTFAALNDDRSQKVQSLAATAGSIPMMTVVAGFSSAVTSMVTYAPNADAVYALDTALNVLGTVCAGCPFLLPVQTILTQVGAQMKVCATVEVLVKPTIS